MTSGNKGGEGEDGFDQGGWGFEQKAKSALFSSPFTFYKLAIRSRGDKWERGTTASPLQEGCVGLWSI